MTGEDRPIAGSPTDLYTLLARPVTSTRAVLDQRDEAIRIAERVNAALSEALAEIDRLNVVIAGLTHDRDDAIYFANTGYHLAESVCEDGLR